MDQNTIAIIVTAICSVIASSGFWAFVQKKSSKNNASTKLLVGLAHDTILSRGAYYLSRGDWITKDEYENLYDYLYVPYSCCGGNGSAAKVMADVKNRLRIVDQPIVTSVSISH